MVSEGRQGHGVERGEKETEKETHFSQSSTPGVYLIASHKIEWRKFGEHTVQSGITKESEAGTRGHRRDGHDEEKGKRTA